MKPHIQVRKIKVILGLVLLFGLGVAQAAPLLTLPSIQAKTRWFLTRVDTTSSVGSYPSIAFDPGTGTPWISYYDDTNTSLMVAHYVGSGGNCGLTNDWYCETVDNTASVGMYSSIAVFPDEPGPINTQRIGVAYYDATNGALKFAEYTCYPAPCAWRIATIEDADYPSAPTYGSYSSLKYGSDGVPRIAYYLSAQFVNDELRYTYRVTSGGNCGVGDAAEKWTCWTVDSGNGMGQYASLDLSYNDVPFISYYNGSAGDLKLAKYVGSWEVGNCGSSNFWYCYTVDSDSDAGKYTSVAAPSDAGDTVRMAYYHVTLGNLRYAYGVSGSGNCGGGAFQCYDIDTIGSPSLLGISLAVDSIGVPLIAYKDNDPEPAALKVAQPASSLDLQYGNCGPFDTWQCTILDNSGMHVLVANYVSIAISPSDLAMIAYSKYVDIASTYILWAAYQRMVLFLPIVTK